MLETLVKNYQDYLNKEAATKNELFADSARKKISLQVCLFKIPNLINDKQILCKLPNPLVNDENMPEICLIVKDMDKKDRDYEQTIRKYEKIIKRNELQNLIKKIMPLKQLNLEFRPFETKRALCTSYDLFLADECLHDILFNGSRLGKEFQKRRKMPIEIDMRNEDKLKDAVMEVLNSTVIRLTGKGAVVDINAFMSDHSVEQAIENINVIKDVLIRNLPGGEKNIRSICIKSTNSLAMPIYENAQVTSCNEVTVSNNMNAAKVKIAKKKSTKRLNRLKKLNNKKDASKGSGEQSSKLEKKEKIKPKKSIKITK